MNKRPVRLDCVAFLIAALASAPAAAFQAWPNADGLIPFYGRIIDEPRHLTGDADLDRAVEICDRHTQPSMTVYPEGGAPRSFAEGWEGCHKVMSRWDDSEAGRRHREAIEKDRADKAFISEFVR